MEGVDKESLIEDLIGSDEVGYIFMKDMKGTDPQIKDSEGEEIEDIYYKPYYVSVQIGDGSHAIVLLCKEENWFLFDPNGVESKYVLFAKKQLSDQYLIDANIMEIKQSSHQKILESDLFYNGMTTSRSKGWCSLWALFILYLDDQECTIDEITKFANNEIISSPENWSFVMVALRDGIVHFFRNLCNNFDHKYKEKITGYDGNLNVMEFEMWKEIFTKTPKEQNGVFSSGEESQTNYYSIMSPTPREPEGNVKIRIGSQRFNSSHCLSKDAIYVRFTTSFSMLDFSIGMHIPVKGKETLGQYIYENYKETMPDFSLRGAKMEELIMYKIVAQKEEHTKNLKWASDNSSKLQDTFRSTGSLFKPLKHREKHVKRVELIPRNKKFASKLNSFATQEFFKDEEKYPETYTGDSSFLNKSEDLTLTFYFLDSNSRPRTVIVNFNVFVEESWGETQIKDIETFRKAFENSPRLDAILQEAWKNKNIREKNDAMKVEGKKKLSSYDESYRLSYKLFDARTYTSKKKFIQAFVIFANNSVAK